MELIDHIEIPSTSVTLESSDPSPEQLRINKSVTMPVKPVTGVRYPRLNGSVFAVARARGAAIPPATRAFRGLTFALDAPTKPRPGP